MVGENSKGFVGPLISKCIRGIYMEEISRGPFVSIGPLALQHQNLTKLIPIFSSSKAKIIRKLYSSCSVNDQERFLQNSKHSANP